MTQDFRWQSALLKQAGVLHGFTDASFGVLRYGRNEPDDVVARNRQNWRKANGLLVETIVLCEQVHANDVILVDTAIAKDPFVQLGKADALVTNVPGLVLVVKSADCVPVLLYDAAHRAVAAIHSGWKGTALNIIGETIKKMSEAYGTEAKDVLAGIGPAVCAKHYDVTQTTDGRIEKFAQLFEDDPSIVVRDGSQTALDVSQACRWQCVKAGIPEDKIELSGICTFEDSRWPSYRREGSAWKHDIWSFIVCPHTSS